MIEAIKTYKTIRSLTEDLGLLWEENKFIQRAIKKPGQLHRDLGYPQGANIPDNEIEKAADKKGKVGRRARFALVLRKIRRNRKSKKLLRRHG